MTVQISKPDFILSKEILSVAGFTRRYRFSKVEENRLTKLFGQFASKQELLMNAGREASFR
jgi:hypothetical protein